MAERVIIRAVTGDAISAMVTGELGYDPADGLLILAGFAGTPAVALANDPSTGSGLADETAARIAADNALDTRITNETTNRTSADNALSTRITTAQTDADSAQTAADAAQATADAALVAPDPAITWTSGIGAPTTTEDKGSLYSRTDGTVGATLYLSRGGGTWTALA
jgi:hypothetical protein